MKTSTEREIETQTFFTIVPAKKSDKRPWIVKYRGIDGTWKEWSHHGNINKAQDQIEKMSKLMFAWYVHDDSR